MTLIGFKIKPNKISSLKTCICTICNKALKEDKFSPSAWHSETPQYRRCRKCKSMLDKNRREKFKLENPEGYAEHNREKKRLYIERYPDKYREQKKRYWDRFKKKYPERFYNKSLGRITLRNARLRGIPCDLTNVDIREWFLKQEQKCDYCGLTLKKIKQFYKKTGTYFKDRRLQIDRKDNKIGYTFENMTLSCRICNDHKSDFFSYKDFKIIAQKYIKKTINKKIKEK